jgi:hypothetical protein
MLLKIRFDGNSIHNLFNLNSYIKNTNGVLSSTSSEVSCLDLSLKKDQFSTKNSHKSYSIFNTKVLPNLLNTVFLTIGELSDKITSLKIKQPILIWMSLASFDNRNTVLNKKSDFNNILGNLKLPKFFIFEESFDFISISNTKLGNFVFEGDDDNDLFRIVGDELRAGRFDFSSADDGTKYYVRIQGRGAESGESDQRENQHRLTGLTTLCSPALNANIIFCSIVG